MYYHISFADDVSTVFVPTKKKFKGIYLKKEPKKKEENNENEEKEEKLKAKLNLAEEFIFEPLWNIWAKCVVEYECRCWRKNTIQISFHFIDWIEEFKVERLAFLAETNRSTFMQYVKLTNAL